MLTNQIDFMLLITNTQRIISATSSKVANRRLGFSRKSSTQNLFDVVGIDPIINRIKINKLNYLEIRTNLPKT